MTLTVAAGPVTAVAARVRGARKVFGSTVAVDDVDLDIPHGAVLGMLGPNGSGKTTLIRMLLGLIRPTAGTVELLGRAVPEAAATVLPHVGALVEGPGFHPFLSGRDRPRREQRLGGRDPPQVLPAGEERMEARALHQRADVRQHGRHALGHRSAEQFDGARGGAGQAQQHPDQRGLAGAVRPEHAENGAVRDVEVDVVHRHGRPEDLAHPPDPGGDSRDRVRGDGERHGAITGRARR